MCFFRLLLVTMVAGAGLLDCVTCASNSDFKTVIVTFKKNINHIFHNHDNLNLESQEEKAHHLRNMLSEHAEETHAELLQELSTFPYTQIESLWIANVAIVRNCSPTMISFINGLPFVEEARAEKIIPLPQVTIVPFNKTQLGSVQWGPQKIGAPELWAQGIKGEGIRVATIDTGVRASHEALKGNYLGVWHDAIDGKPDPYDDYGHGTHTMGTIVGQTNGIGVAPGAKWMSCRACNKDGCSESHLLSCGQFLTCPDKECTKPPHIISNSWGGGQGDTWFNNVIAAWKKAGIIPVFSNGNDGPNCKTANSPGDQPDVIAVGATDSTDAVASFSSVGPSIQGVTKPEVCAPGVDVVSSVPNDDESYESLSGTSMACPHVAGAIALLLSHHPSGTFTFDDAKKFLFSGAQPNVTSSADCGGSAKIPNNYCGNGRINVLDSIAKIGKVMDNTCNSTTASKRKRPSRQGSAVRNRITVLNHSHVFVTPVHI